MGDKIIFAGPDQGRHALMQNYVSAERGSMGAGGDVGFIQDGGDIITVQELFEHERQSLGADPYRDASVVVFCVNADEPNQIESLGQRLAAIPEGVRTIVALSSRAPELDIEDDQIGPLSGQFPRVSFVNVLGGSIHALKTKVSAEVGVEHVREEVGVVIAPKADFVASLQVDITRAGKNLSNESDNKAIARLVGEKVERLPAALDTLNDLCELYRAVGFGKGDKVGANVQMSCLRQRTHHFGGGNYYRDTTDSGYVARRCKRKAAEVFKQMDKKQLTQEVKDKFAKILCEKTDRFALTNPANNFYHTQIEPLAAVESSPSVSPPASKL